MGNTSRVTHRLVTPDNVSEDLHAAVLRPPVVGVELQPQVEDSVGGADSQVIPAAGTDQISNTSLLRRSERRVTRPVKYTS